MFIPYAVDAPLDRRPIANWLVWGIIVLVFILQTATSEKPEKAIEKPVENLIRTTTADKETIPKQEDTNQTITGPMARFVLNGWGIGLLTYIWLHGGVASGVVRVIGNLIFLWPFGNAVCSKIGNKLYPFIFLGFGLLAGIIHLLLGGHPAVGASGVISGIIGMYIVLFPENSMNCFVLLPRPMSVSISGYWLILLWFIFDIFEVGMSTLNIAYCAHLLCLGAGFGLAVLMLKKQWLVMESGEESILQILSKKKKEEEDKGEEKKEREKKEGKNGEKKYSTTFGEEPERTTSEKVEPKRETAKPEKAADDFIRFRCECGHKIKIHKKDAGKTGRCPKCSRWVEAPRE